MKVANSKKKQKQKQKLVDIYKCIHIKTRNKYS